MMMMIVLVLAEEEGTKLRRSFIDTLPVGIKFAVKV